MTTTIKKYEGDYTDLDGLLFASSPLSSMAAALSSYDMWVGYDDDKPKGYFLISPPDKAPLVIDPLRQAPYVAYIYSPNNGELTQALLTKIKEVVKDYGWSHFLAFNFTDKSDEEWAKSFAAAGASQRMGSLHTFDVEV